MDQGRYEEMRTAIVTGAGGFLGSNMVKYLSEKTDFEILSIAQHPLKRDRFERESIIVLNLLGTDLFRQVLQIAKINKNDWVFDFASVVGGFRFLRDCSAEIMYESTIMNLNVLEEARQAGVGKIMFASSACVYPSTDKGLFTEADAYPINPENDYGLQKIYMERLYTQYLNRYGLKVYLPRFQNVYGPYIQYNGPRAKGLADICRKVMEAEEGGEIEIFGDGNQIRDYTFAEDAMDGVLKLMNTEVHTPVNISSGKAITINDYVKEIISVLGKKVTIKHTEEKDVGVRMRVSANDKAREIGWVPNTPLSVGIKKMTDWMRKDMK